MFDFNTEEEWQQMRAESWEYAHNRNKKLIEEWCKKSGVSSPVGYYNDVSDGVMKIYTDKPGYLIGKAGCRVDEFKRELEKEFHKEYTVQFFEVRDGFVNYE